VAFISSDPLASDNVLGIVFTYYLPAFLVAFLVLGALYLVLPRKARAVYLFALLYVVFVFTVHGYFLTGNYSQMDGMSFTKLQIGAKRVMMDIAVYGALLLGTAVLFSKKYYVRVFPIVGIIFLSGLTFFGFHAANIWKVTSQDVQSQAESARQAEVYYFSKTKQNVVVLMLDRAFGFMTDTVFERKSGLRSAFDGFVYYPNCLSSSNATIGGFLSIVGGYDYSSAEIFSRDREPMTKKALEAFSLIPMNLRDKGYDIVYSNVDYDPSTLAKDELRKLGVRINMDGNRYILEKSDESVVARTLLGGGLFRLSGDLFRKKIYRGGTWLTEDPQMTSEYGVGRKYYSQLEALPKVSSTESDRNNYILIHNLMIHNPYVYGADGAIFKDAGRNDRKLDRYPPEDLAKFGTQNDLVHYYSMEVSFKLIADWLQWMKDNGVYDNTKIIVVSDHGRDLTWAGDLGKHTIGDGSLPKTFFVPLLMVKDFGSRGEVRRDMAFMTNADVPSIAFSHIGLSNPFTGGPLKVEKSSPFDLYYIHYALRDSRQAKFTLFDRAQVLNGNIYADENWRMVKKEE
jgi:hypothetical protein